MNRSRAAATLASLAVMVVAAAALRAIEPLEQPNIEVDPDRGLVVTDLPDILSKPEVEPHLTKGLTTTFLFRVDLLGVAKGKQAGGARIEIRYELWDEVFKVQVLEIDGEMRQSEFSSQETLMEWWRGTKLIVVPLDSPPAAEAAQARVTLDVVPFSQLEQIDTQEWFSRSVSSAELARSEGLSTSVSGNEKRASGVFGVLIATSIRRKPLITFRWNLEIPLESLP